MTIDRAANQKMRLCKKAEEERKQVNVRKKYKQVPGRVEFSQRQECQSENQIADRRIWAFSD